jgi:hypothetical protein
MERPMTDREHEQLLATATDRFERRLSEEAAGLRAGDAATQLEIANLRIDMSEQDSATRLEIAKLRGDMSEQDSATRLEIAKLRGDMSEQDSATRLEIATLRADMSEQDLATRLEIAKLRIDMVGQFAESRVHSEARHREMLKWTIVLWVGQAAAVAGIVSALT